MKQTVQLLKQVHYWIGSIGFVFLFCILVLFLSPLFIPYDPYEVNMAMKAQRPSLVHWLGTDGLGRDILSRILVGGRVTLGTSFLVLAGTVLIGIPVGLISGYVGGLMDRVFMRVADAFLAFPDFLIAIVLTGLLGPHILNLMISIIAVKWIAYARIVRNTVRTESNKDYVAVAKLNGVGTIRMVYKHFIPHVVRHAVVLIPLDIGKVILIIASLSYIGLGVQPPEAEWGNMLNEGRQYFQQSPFLMIIPGLSIMLTVAMANMVGDRIQKRLEVSNRVGVN
ncbi:ABC transporter permease subunit [Bacillus altitudinis]|uniref:nickel transporter permease n=1 Tax=Bacillus TaxID=1386 RepID=UPI001C386410|nr:nickel transporter permease [Bacillus altitudinis]MBV5112951.1 ABC transporter permease subunit [Bacillus altitudinis]MBW2729425.1 ABC transporter permease subunit [Bacillus altitudinis]MDR4997093.1 ABC transporter permease subunit [Bacillus altitudinis]